MKNTLVVFTFLFLTAYASIAKVSNLWIIGDALSYGWDLDAAAALLSTPENASIYTGTIYLKANEEFKFMTTKEWGGLEYGVVKDEAIDNGALFLARGFNDDGYGKIKVSENANYYITVDTENLIATIKKSDYQDFKISRCSLFLVGDATPGGWSVDDGTPFYQNPQTPYVYSVDTELNNGEFKIATAIKGAGKWENKYYYFCDPNDPGKIILNHSEDTKWKIREKGKYSLTVNTLANTISIRKTGEIEGDELPQLGESIHNYKAPLYWSVYEYCYELEKRGVSLNNMDISSHEWDKIIEWVATELLPYGFDMVCTDGFIPMLSKDDSGYMTHYGSVSLKDLVAKCRQKGLRLGVYDNPLWIHAPLDLKVQGTNYTFGSLTYNGSNSVANPGAEDVWFTWAVADNQGTRDYIDGFFKHYSELGVEFIRIDFLSWYEDGKDRNMGIVGKGFGRESYRKALEYIAESANKYGIFTSLVMPHLYEDAEIEAAYGNMVRIVADTADGGWWHCSMADQGKVYSSWPNCMNMFDGFTYWSHISGRNKVILDGDFTRLNKFTSEAECQTVISLQLMAGGPIAVADQYNTIGNKLKYYINNEMLDLNRDRFVGHPLANDLGSDNSVWLGQMSTGEYVLGFFNRSSNFPTTFKQNLKDFGIEGEYLLRDLWSHQDLGISSEVNIKVPARGCKILKLKDVSSSFVNVNTTVDEPTDDNTEYYTLSGVKVKNPNNGFFIKKHGEKASKLHFE